MTKEQQLAAWKKLKKHFLENFQRENYTGFCKLLKNHQVEYSDQEYQYLIKIITDDAKSIGKPAMLKGHYWLYKAKSTAPRLKYLQAKIKSYQASADMVEILNSLSDASTEN